MRTTVLACVEAGEDAAEAILEADSTQEAVLDYWAEHAELVVADG